MLLTQGALFALMAAGFLVRRIGIVSDEGRKSLIDLIMYLILPCSILKSFCGDFSQDTLKSCLTVFLLGLGIQIFSFVYGRIVYRSQPEARRKCLQYGIMCSNSGLLGNPVAEGMYGAEGLMLASVFLIPLRIMMWSLGIAVFSGTTDRRATAKKVLTHPCILACVLGIAIMLTGLRLPELPMKVIGYIGQCNTALCMMVIGMILVGVDFRKMITMEVAVYALHRLVIIATERGLAVILSAMPAGASTSILAAKYNMEPEFATKLVVFSTVLSIATIFIWSIVLA